MSGLIGSMHADGRVPASGYSIQMVNTATQSGFRRMASCILWRRDPAVSGPSQAESFVSPPRRALRRPGNSPPSLLCLVTLGTAGLRSRGSPQTHTNEWGVSDGRHQRCRMQKTVSRLSPAADASRHFASASQNAADYGSDLDCIG